MKIVKDCPVCGAKAIEDAFLGIQLVKCTNPKCEFMIAAKDKESARRAWNSYPRFTDFEDWTPVD